MNKKDLMNEALERAMAGIESALKAHRISRFAPKKAVSVEKVEVSPGVAKEMDDSGDEKDMEIGPVEGGLTLDGVMHKRGNSGKEIADSMSDMSPEAIEEILRNAK